MPSWMPWLASCIWRGNERDIFHQREPINGSLNHGEASNEETDENDYNIADGWSIRAGILIKSEMAEQSEGLVIRLITPQ